MTERRKVPQPHGGYLVPGAGGGPQPGSGRPPDAIRAEMRGNLADILPGLLRKYEAGELDAVRFAEFLARYGLGAKELVIASTEAAAFFDCVYRATVEQVGEVQAEAIKLRAVALMDAKA